MTKAQLGHSANDVTAGLVEELSALSDKDAQIRFLEAGISHAEQQLELADKQYEAIADKRDVVVDMYDSKLEEADRIRMHAREDLAAINREFQALGG